MWKPRTYVRVLCVLQKAKRETHFVLFLHSSKSSELSVIFYDKSELFYYHFKVFVIFLIVY